MTVENSAVIIDGGWNQTMPEVFDRAVRARPETVALITAWGSATYVQLDDVVGRLAGVLRRCGVAKGDRVAVSLPNSVEIVATFHAVARLGAIWVGINRQLTASEKHYILRDSGARMLIGEPECVRSLTEVRNVEFLERVPGAVDDDWSRRLADVDPVAFELNVVVPTDPIGLAYTSGTTGFPKGVLHSHRNVIVAAGVQVATRGYQRDIRKVDWMSLNILNVMTVSVVLVTICGGTSIILDTTRALEMAEAIQCHQADVFQAAPTIMYGFIVDANITREHLSSLDEILTGSAPTTEELQERFADKFGLHVVNTYGLTEAPTMLAMDPVDHGDHEPGSSGVLQPHVDIYTLDEDGTELPRGSTGELCVRPIATGRWSNVYTPMLGYWNNPEATAKALHNGALHTGDIGYVSASNNVYVIDRKNALIIRGGANVYPAEVERIIKLDHRVADCAVVGLTDERLGERVVVAVELAAGATLSVDELRAHCASELARYKVPDQVRFIDVLPRNTMNKVVRAKVVELFTPPGANRG